MGLIMAVVSTSAGLGDKQRAKDSAAKRGSLARMRGSKGGGDQLMLIRRCVRLYCQSERAHVCRMAPLYEERTFEGDAASATSTWHAGASNSRQEGAGGGEREGKNGQR